MSSSEESTSAHNVPMPSRQSPLYENCSVYSPRGALMFRCSRKKVEWYLHRKLAISLNEARTVIQLTFEPKGNGRVGEGEEYYLEDRENICVGCGGQVRLTAHHIVPFQYRKFMPLEIKSHASHDIVLLCNRCHDAYENKALGVKKQYAKKYDIPLEGRGYIPHPQHRRLHAAAKALLLKDHEIPAWRLEELESQIREFFGIDGSVDDEVLKQALELPLLSRSDDFEEHGQVVVRRMSESELEEFIRMWRRHFLEHVKPQFLSEMWRVEDPVRNRDAAYLWSR
ncbi:hypothetical protein SpCBS45565_g00907 [Spizellomyces sp. 'palustris']|nr:hypothetical protein SpCBS45565_g00907 [Spizellomyces sp. 'palustris']